MTYNIGSDVTSPEDLIPLLRESGADVIALEEVGDAQAEFIDDALADLYPYRILHGGGIAGMGILSRYPFIERDDPFYISGPVPHLRVVLGIHGTPVTVIVGHPPRPILDGFHYRPHPAAWPDTAALADLATAGGPAVMLGDFNMTDRSPHYQIPVRAGLHDSFREAGWGFGFSYPRFWRGITNMPPLVRIDYIWHTEHFTAIDAWVGEDGGSDHLPVLAVLRLKPVEGTP
jgi:endonuclease/exonuclease/phosphatase (EEP) superfamily protein YafD